MIIDYSAHFWGDKHIGYNVLYDHMKKGEDSVHELLTFIKERTSMEDDILKCLNRQLIKASTYTTNNGSLADAWRLTKNALEFWIEIKTKLVHNLGDLSRDVFRYQEELIKIRKKAKDIETLEAINLMQTTTTCLQKAKETYLQRCAEVINLKNSSKDWTSTNTKEYLKLKFFFQLATLLETAQNCDAKTAIEYKQNLELIDVEEIMLRFIEEKGTGTDVPKKLNWTEADELPQELDVLSAVHSHSSSSNNSSAIVVPNTTFSSVTAQNPPPTTVDDLLNFDDNCAPSKLLESGKSSQRKSQQKIQRFKQSASEADEEDSDSNSENAEGEQQTNIRINTSDKQQNQHQSSSISTVQHQISSWLGRQKQAASHWRLKKHSASQSSLPAAVANEMAITNEKLQSNNQFAEFSKSFGVNEGSGVGSGLSKRYQKKINAKNSINEITQTKMKRAYSQFQLEGENCDISVVEEPKIIDPLQVFGPPPPLPISEPIPPPLFDNQSPNIQSVSFIYSNEKQQNINYNISQSTDNNRWSADSSSSDDEDNSTKFQTTKIRQLQIRPLVEQQEFQKNTSLDELRSAIGQISLPRNSIIENDPWAASDAETTTSADISVQSNQMTNQVFPPLRAALTGDSQYRRCFAPSNDFGQSFSIFSTSNSIARARPRSHTPLVFGPTSTFSKSQMATSLNQTKGNTSQKIDSSSTQGIKTLDHPIVELPRK
uniref:GMIP/FCHO2-like FCH domain-containing protein n=1 Tax=Meloidogyne javanica TaxID=6303 RepID=A0A915LFB3_MELJA